MRNYTMTKKTINIQGNIFCLLFFISLLLYGDLRHSFSTQAFFTSPGMGGKCPPYIIFQNKPLVENDQRFWGLIPNVLENLQPQMGFWDPREESSPPRFPRETMGKDLDPEQELLHGVFQHARHKWPQNFLGPWSRAQKWRRKTLDSPYGQKRGRSQWWWDGTRQDIRCFSRWLIAGQSLGNRCGIPGDWATTQERGLGKEECQTNRLNFCLSGKVELKIKARPNYRKIILCWWHT